MSAHQALLAGYANPMIVCDSADFDGTNDYMARGAGLTGAVDSKLGILSMWIYFTVYTLGTRYFCSTSSNFLFLSFTGDKLSIGAKNSAGTDILLLRTSNAYATTGTWMHILASWDLGNAAGHLYINGVSDLGTSTLTNDTIDYTDTDWFIGANPAGGQKHNGLLAEVYFAPGQYLDFSNSYFRYKYRSASGKPVHLGTTGALPTGTAPLVYQHLDNGEAAANFATNRGTGGNFTITGTLTTGASSPSD